MGGQMLNTTRRTTHLQVAENVQNDPDLAKSRLDILTDVVKNSERRDDGSASVATGYYGTAVILPGDRSAEVYADYGGQRVKFVVDEAAGFTSLHGIPKDGTVDNIIQDISGSAALGRIQLKPVSR